MAYEMTDGGLDAERVARSAYAAHRNALAGCGVAATVEDPETLSEKDQARWLRVGKMIAAGLLEQYDGVKVADMAAILHGVGLNVRDTDAAKDGFAKLPWEQQRSWEAVARHCAWLWDAHEPGDVLKSMEQYWSTWAARLPHPANGSVSAMYPQIHSTD